ncbi:hypothetical protein JDV02_002731 [Purpureocillium takamizusanense]|uniref:Secreted protein n=1 Tax=Purpureocillium takamizusanense TaxID=2060973 RepID=A0A9Q8Q997_9HYPO|nr:uncharacterized protein JDV02_002731 [Purpureocillium takamizusanense]UNI16284.1 hypothetical protein JDV02_002731 [Purpureocillium takamizusanense]
MQIFGKLTAVALVLLFAGSSVGTPVPGAGESSMRGNGRDYGGKYASSSSREGRVGGSGAFGGNSASQAWNTPAQASKSTPSNDKDGGLNQFKWYPNPNSRFYDPKKYPNQRGTPTTPTKEELDKARYYGPSSTRRAVPDDKDSAGHARKRSQPPGKDKYNQGWNSNPWGSYASGSKAYKSPSEPKGGMPVRSGNSKDEQRIYDPKSERQYKSPRAISSPNAAKQRKRDETNASKPEAVVPELDKDVADKSGLHPETSQ